MLLWVGPADELEASVKAGMLVTPTLMKWALLAEHRIIGSLEDIEALLLALELNRASSQMAPRED